MFSARSSTSDLSFLHGHVIKLVGDDSPQHLSLSTDFTLMHAHPFLQTKSELLDRLHTTLGVSGNYLLNQLDVMLRLVDVLLQVSIQGLVLSFLNRGCIVDIRADQYPDMALVDLKQHLFTKLYDEYEVMVSKLSFIKTYPHLMTMMGSDNHTLQEALRFTVHAPTDTNVIDRSIFLTHRHELIRIESDMSSLSGVENLSEKHLLTFCQLPVIQSGACDANIHTFNHSVITMVGFCNYTSRDVMTPSLLQLLQSIRLPRLTGRKRLSEEQLVPSAKPCFGKS